MGKKRGVKSEEDNGTNKKLRIHEKQSDQGEEGDPDWFSTPPNKTSPDPDPAPALSKRQQKKRKRAEEYHHKRLPNKPADPPQSNDTPVSVKQEKPDPVASGTIQSVAPSPSISIPPSVPQATAPLIPNSYTTVNALMQMDPNSQMLYTTAAVVTTISPCSKTISSDYNCTLTIVDPSSWDSEILQPRKFTVICFTKEHKEWLPQAKEGDIIILRSLKLKFYRDANQGQGYYNKLKWACYSNGEMVQPTFKPSSMEIEGQQFSPFYQYSVEEVEYCRRLAEWWAGVQALVKESKGMVIDLGAGTAQQTSSPQERKGRRVHRLLKEVTPYIEPRGYFDCTVEVLFKCDRSRDAGPIMCLYVTDYTRLTRPTYDYKGEWINGVDPQTVLPIEMWDDAYEEARKLEKGDVVSLKNVKMKIDRNGNLQGKMSEPKVHQVSQKDADHNSVAKDFFERRRALRKDEVIPELEYRAVSEFLVDEYANCVAEVLAVKTDADPPQFWITDYSFRSELSQTKQAEDWAKGLLGRVLRITLEGGQIEAVKNLEQKTFISIRNLRLKRQTDGVFGGHMGGHQDLIHVVKEDTSDNVAEAIGQLKRRKASYPATFCRDLKPVAGKVVQKQMLAKVVDVSPGSMQDFITNHCTKCNNDIPPRHRACVTCNDLSHNFVETRLTCGLRIEDEAGDCVDVTLQEDSKLLKNIELKDPQEDRETLARLQSVFIPLVGNLDRQSGPLGDQYAIFEISCWDFEGQITCTLEDIQRP